MTPVERRTAAAVAAVAGAAFVVLVVLLVPTDPVPGAELRPVGPGEVFSKAEIDRAEAFSGRARALSLGSLAVSLVVACVLGFTRMGRAVVDRLRGPWWVRVLQAVAVVVLVGRVVTLPFALLLHDHLRAYGLSVQGWGPFVLDLVKGEAVQVLATTVALAAVMGCARVWRRAWPALAAGLVAALVLAGSFVYPLVVEPLFNRFEPLPAGELRTEVLRVAAEEGVEVDEVLVADASRRTTTVNAYVSGFSGTRRVVLYDTLVEDLPQDQALSVVAHELAHARHDDVLVGSTLGALGAACAVGVLGLVAGVLLRRGGDAGEVTVRDPGAVPLLLALVAVASVLVSPVQSAISRQVEARADVDALATTDDPDAFVELQRQLMLRSLTDPTPPRLTQLWFASHPHGLTRMALAERVAGRD